MDNRKKLFSYKGANQKLRNLVNIRKSYVEPGSIIHTDLWRRYNGRLYHKTINHSKYFKDPETSVHTNIVIGIWNGIRMKIASRNRTEEDNDKSMDLIWNRLIKSIVAYVFRGLISIVDLINLSLTQNNVNLQIL